MTWSDLLWLIFLGVLCTSFAFLATIEVVKKLGAFTVSLSINLEPVYTIILAVSILQALNYSAVCSLKSLHDLKSLILFIITFATELYNQKLY